MKIINDTPRKILRYLMFSKKNKVKLEKPIISKKIDSDIIKYFEKQPNFTNWDEFEIKWDIGIGDDLIAQSNRKEKWFLFDEHKSKIIFRPENYWEKEAERRNTSTHALFIQECHHRGLTMDEFFNIFLNRSQEHNV